MAGKEGIVLLLKSLWYGYLPCRLQPLVQFILINVISLSLFDARDFSASYLVISVLFVFLYWLNLQKHKNFCPHLRQKLREIMSAVRSFGWYLRKIFSTVRGTDDACRSFLIQSEGSDDTCRKKEALVLPRTVLPKVF